jgi:hypothetical protein
MAAERASDETPRVIRARGRWLAVSRPNSPFVVGVFGNSEEDALHRFEQALAAWRELRRSREQAAHAESLHASRG